MTTSGQVVQPALAGRVAVVTGASSGIGLHVALGLARLGASVALVCRNAERGEQARRLVAAAGPAVPRLLLADFAELDAVREVASALRDAFPAVHILVNN